MITHSIHDFSLPLIDGSTLEFRKLKGKRILLVNTASECKFTPQFEALQHIHETYGDKIVVVAIPSNDFGMQEPRDGEELIAFCKNNYQASFLIAEKQVVVGDNMHPLYAWATEVENPDFAGEILWNFEKFVFDENGELIARFRSDVNPVDEYVLEELGVKS